MGTPPPVPTPSLARVIVPRPAPSGFVSMATHGHGPALDAADGRPAMRVTPTLAPLSRRLCLAASLTGSLVWGMGFARAAILEADDDDELLERVKKDRKKRLERQGIIRSSDKETGYLQELVYKMSKVGQAIENNDLSLASFVLGLDADANWVEDVNAAFTKLSFSPEEKVEVDTFNSSLTSLFSSVRKRNIESSKLAFVSSAAALEKWIGLTGLVGQLKGL